MFPLTRPIRQGLATAALLVLTVLPTILVGTYAWRINRPGHIRDVEIELGRQLGLQVTLEAVRYPRPGEITYQGIVLRREEPGGKALAEIARAELVRLVRGENELTLHAEGLALQGESPRQALFQVGPLFQRSFAIPYDRIHLAAPSCELDLDRQGLHYTALDVAGEFLSDHTNPTVRVAYRLGESSGVTRCELMLSRNRAADPVETALSLKTLEGHPLPARVLDVFFETDDWLGPRAKVNGSLSLSQAGAGDWEADFQGNLSDVDLATLVGHRFPRHHLTGTARIALQHAHWGDRPGQGRGWREARGEMAVGQGTIGVDLVAALAREMKFRLSPRIVRLDPRKTDVEFRALGVAFDMQNSGEIQFAGALGNEFAPDTVLAGPTAALAFAPTGRASVHGLIKTLFPVADAPPGVMVPLTNQSRVLLSLPVAPELAAKPGRALGGN
jgi:hypothetical protein